MKIYPSYDEFLSRNLKHIPYKWTQQGMHIDIEIAGIQFEAICQGFDKDVGENVYRLSALFGAFANRKSMTQRQLIAWLLQKLFEMWCNLSSTFDCAALINWLSTKWDIDANVLPDNVTVRIDTGVIETGAGVSVPAEALTKKSETDTNKSIDTVITDKLSKTSKDTETQIVKTDIDIKKSKLQLKNERICESIQALVLHAFNLTKADLQKDVRAKSNPVCKCKLVIALLCLNANQTIEMISTYAGYKPTSIYSHIKNMSKFLAIYDIKDAKYSIWQYLGLSDIESHNLRDILNADILYRILQKRQDYKTWNKQ